MKKEIQTKNFLQELEVELAVTVTVPSEADVVMPAGWPDDSEDDDSVEVEDSEDDAEEDDSDVELADVSLVVVETPIGPFSVVIDAAAEVADAYLQNGWVHIN